MPLQMFKSQHTHLVHKQNIYIWKFLNPFLKTIQLMKVPYSSALQERGVILKKLWLANLILLQKERETRLGRDGYCWGLGEPVQLLLSEGFPVCTSH
jgi:hypothetical protein